MFKLNTFKPFDLAKTVCYGPLHLAQYIQSVPVWFKINLMTERPTLIKQDKPEWNLTG